MNDLSDFIIFPSRPDHSGPGSPDHGDVAGEFRCLISVLALSRMTVERDRLVTDHARRQEESALRITVKTLEDRHSQRLADLDGADLVEAIENHEGLTALQEVVDPIGPPPECRGNRVCQEGGDEPAPGDAAMNCQLAKDHGQRDERPQPLNEGACSGSGELPGQPTHKRRLTRTRVAQDDQSRPIGHRVEDSAACRPCLDRLFGRDPLRTQPRLDEEIPDGDVRVVAIVRQADEPDVSVPVEDRLEVFEEESVVVGIQVIRRRGSRRIRAQSRHGLALEEEMRRTTDSGTGPSSLIRDCIRRTLPRTGSGKVSTCASTASADARPRRHRWAAGPG